MSLTRVLYYYLIFNDWINYKANYGLSVIFMPLKIQRLRRSPRQTLITARTQRCIVPVFFFFLVFHLKHTHTKICFKHFPIINSDMIKKTHRRQTASMPPERKCTAIIEPTWKEKKCFSFTWNNKKHKFKSLGSCDFRSVAGIYSTRSLYTPFVALNLPAELC